MYHATIPTSQSYSATTLGTLVTDRDFTFQAISECYHGVVSIGGWNPWVVNNTHYNVNYGNVGTEPLNGSVVVTHHLLTTFVSSIPMPDMVDGQMLTWEVIGMAAGANVSINIAYHTDSTALTTDTVSATVVLKNDHLDQTPPNNADVISTHPTTSFAPNGKTRSRLATNSNTPSTFRIPGRNMR